MLQNTKNLSSSKSCTEAAIKYIRVPGLVGKHETFKNALPPIQYVTLIFFMNSKSMERKEHNLV